MSYVIEVDQASKRFGKKVALQEVSLRVPAGVVFALLGENGAGKSTLIRSLMGYHRLNSGRLQILGLDPGRQPLEVRRRVGYVSDAPALYDWMTVEQVGWFVAGFYPEGYLQRFAQLGQDFQLPATTKVRDLSKGMRAKTALAAALASDPELLILDEPTSGLDPVVRRQFLESMVDRAATGKTVLLSSHQVHEVERIADWVAVIHRGQLQVAAPLEELKSRVMIVTWMATDPLLPAPAWPEGTRVLGLEQSGRQWRAVLDGWTDDSLDQLRGQLPGCDVKSCRPSLEDLYIAFTQDRLPEPTGASSADQSDSPIRVA